MQKWAATRNYPFLYSTFFDLRNCYINSWDHSLLASSLAVPFSFRPTVGSQWSYPWYSPKVVSRGEWTFREWTFREFFRATQWVHLSHLTRGLDWREGVGWVRSVKVLVTKSFQNHDFFFWSIWKFYPRKLKIYRPWCLLQRFLWILWEKFFFPREYDPDIFHLEPSIPDSSGWRRLHPGRSWRIPLQPAMATPMTESRLRNGWVETIRHQSQAPVQPTAHCLVGCKNRFSAENLLPWCIWLHVAFRILWFKHPMVRSWDFRRQDLNQDS